MMRFFQIQLRTSDVAAARAFYAAVFGARVFDILQLQAQAVARGARPHWLGYLGVDDVDRATAAFTQRGATALGPKWVSPEGLQAAVMRDPGGASVALAKPATDAPLQSAASAGSADNGIWYLLNTANVQAAKANYGELFGWSFEQPMDLGSVGVFHPFAWQRGGPLVGAMGDIAARPGVHAHWLFHLRVPALDDALAAVRDHGGLVVGPFTLPSGDRVAACDDPQGAAFALLETRFSLL
jgi:predicted enzyme related to lactoylglutathione lyase